MPIRIEIENTDVQEVKGTSQKSGKDYCFYRQQAVAFIGDSKYPDKFEITHDSPHDALASGTYLLDLNTAASVDRFGGLGIDSKKLTFSPAQPKAQTGAPASAVTTAAANRA